ncbi:MAG: thaumatin family protein [Myxococcales bacterium]
MSVALCLCLAGCSGEPGHTGDASLQMGGDGAASEAGENAQRDAGDQRVNDAGGSIDAATAPDAGGAGDTHFLTGDGQYACRRDGDGTTTAVFINRCSSALHVRGSDIAGATVAPQSYACRDLGTAKETLSAKRYWGFLADDPGAEHYTLAEFTFNTDFHDFDWYNISHVDAHNLTMQIVPLDRSNCKTLTCSDPKLLTDCPAVGRDTNAQGELISCVSPDRDNGNSVVALHFESCDDAYAWSGDDQNGKDPSPVRACAGEDWAIVFCP